jgi:CubicO group peptidase (beta-lactamase class C family)
VLRVARLALKIRAIATNPQMQLLPNRTVKVLPTLLCSTALIVGQMLAPPALVSDPPCAVPVLSGDDWQLSTPQKSGFDPIALCSTLSAVTTGNDNIHSVIIERHGRLVAELYRKGSDHPINVFYGLWNPFATDVDFGPTTRHDTRSVSKSVISLLFGMAKQQGKIKSLATPVLDFYPEFADLRSPERNAITLQHLLTITSGLEWDEGSLPNDETRLYWKSEPYRFVLSRPIIHLPAKVFNYNSGGTAVLADILTRINGKPWLDLARAELFEPLGITDWEWVSDLHGRPLAFTGLRMRPRDMLKLGRLMLNHGEWRGQQIVPDAWVAESLRPRVGTGHRSPPTNPKQLQYGYQWWSGSADWRGKKLAWSAAFGNGGQRIFIVPELDMTVVVTAGAYGSPQINHTVNRLLGQLVLAVSQ